MSEFKSFRDWKSRAPTWAEREELKARAAESVEDVYVSPDEAPPAFWEAVVLVTTRYLVSIERSAQVWNEWMDEMVYAFGIGPLNASGHVLYPQLIRGGIIKVHAAGRAINVGFPVTVRLAAIEHLLDVVQPQQTTFEERVNDRARWFKVGARLEGTRFVPATSEHLHTEIVRPTLILLSDVRFATVNDLYRKGFDRALSNDPAGAVTAAQASVEEILRVGLQSQERRLEPLARRAREAGWLTQVEYQVITRLEALRPESDAHDAGTSEFNVAMLALHLSGSVLVHLGRSGPFAAREDSA